MDNERYLDDTKRVLEKKGYIVDKWGSAEATINKSIVFIRPGSQKSKGWQVTFRGEKSDSSKSCLAVGHGFLLMPRGPIMLIPLREVKMLVESVDSNAFQRDTVDIFVRFEEQKITLVYKTKEIDITKHAVENYP
jgi:hypothetical protein